MFFFKIIFIVIAVFSLTAISRGEMKDSNIVSRASGLAGDRELFYHGFYGWVGKGLYIKRHDPENNFYSSDKCVFKGGPSNNVEIYAVQIKEEGAFIQKVDSVSNEETRTFVVFSPDYVYLLQFSERKYGKYKR